MAKTEAVSAPVAEVNLSPETTAKLATWFRSTAREFGWAGGTTESAVAYLKKIEAAWESIGEEA